MARENNSPDLTMLALAAYDAIRKNMEENNGEEKKAAPVHAAGAAAQSGTRHHDRAPGGAGTREQRPATQAGYRLITI
nr:hypothetical protein [uncultured Oscillibacter sp.]